MAKKQKAQEKSHRVHHVVPKSSGQWAIKREGITRAIRVFSTRKDAIEFAHDMSRKQGAEVIIHDSDGKVMSTQNYENSEEMRPESGFGCARGLIIVPPEFDEPLEEFNEHI